MKVTATGTLAARARQLGQGHAAAGITPFGDADYVYWDAGSIGSIGLMTALGETGPATEENHPARMAALEAYCDALASPAGTAVQAPFPESLLDPERAASWLAVLNEECARRGLPPLEPAGGAR
jgi:hypothetical protein